MTSKAWIATDVDGERSDVVFARNYGEAKRLGADALGLGADECAVSRLRELDGYTGDLDDWKSANGWRTECGGCYRVIPYGQDFCSDACRVARKEETMR